MGDDDSSLRLQFDRLFIFFYFFRVRFNFILLLRIYYYRHHCFYPAPKPNLSERLSGCRDSEDRLVVGSRVLRFPANRYTINEFSRDIICCKETNSRYRRHSSWRAVLTPFRRALWALPGVLWTPPIASASCRPRLWRYSLFSSLLLRCSRSRLEPLYEKTNGEFFFF